MAWHVKGLSHEIWDQHWNVFSRKSMIIYLFIYFLFNFMYSNINQHTLKKKLLCFQNHLMFLIIPVFILVQYCRLNTTREWLDTTRTTRTGGETMVYGLSGRGCMVICISLVTLHFNLDSTTHTTRTGRTGRETMVHESYNWWTA